MTESWDLTEGLKNQKLVMLNLRIIKNIENKLLKEQSLKLF